MRMVRGEWGRVEEGQRKVAAGRAFWTCLFHFCAPTMTLAVRSIFPADTTTPVSEAYSFRAAATRCRATIVTLSSGGNPRPKVGWFLGEDQAPGPVAGNGRRYYCLLGIQLSI